MIKNLAAKAKSMKGFARMMSIVSKEAPPAAKVFSPLMLTVNHRRLT